MLILDLDDIDVEVMESSEDRIVKWLQETMEVNDIPPVVDDATDDDAEDDDQKEEIVKKKAKKCKSAKIHIHIPN